MKNSIRQKFKAFVAATLVATLTLPFTVNVKTEAVAVDANYARLLQHSLYFFDANMCGGDVGDSSAMAWRDDCHNQDKTISTDYGVMDLSGGFHDAGDQIKFNLPASYTASTLGLAYYEMKDAFTQTGQTEHLKQITDRFADYIRKCMVMNDDNTLKAFCYQVADGDDHNVWLPPEQQTAVRKAYFITKEDKGTDQLAGAAAALASNYVNFGNAKDLEAAKILYNAAQEWPKGSRPDARNEEFYSRYNQNYDDYLALASTWLNIATGDSTYKTNAGGNDWGPMDWDAVWQQVNILNKRWSVVADDLDSNKDVGLNDMTGKQFYFVDWCDGWGSATLNVGVQMVGLIYDKNNSSATWSNWAKGQMQYLLGDNTQNKCYVTGFNEYSVKFPHHVAASGLTSDTGNTPHKNVLIGGLVGGPEKADGTHNDVTSNYQGNEPAIDYNAGLVGAAAGLYLKYGSGQTTDTAIVGVTRIYPTSGDVTTTAPISTTTTSATAGKCGDINGDDDINTADIILLAKYLTGRVGLAAIVVANSDCQADSAINAEDLLALLKYMTGEVSSLPIGTVIVTTPTSTAPTATTPTTITTTDTAPTETTPTETTPTEPTERKGILRTVLVSNVAELNAALSDAKPGDEIVLKSGVYEKSQGGTNGARFHGNVSGTAENPIYIRSEDPDNPAILDGGDGLTAYDQGGGAKGGKNSSGYVLYIVGGYWVVEDLELQNAQKGIVLDKSNYSVIRNCYIHHTGEEALAIRDNSSYCRVEYTTITDTGFSGIYSEGIYVGVSYSNQSKYSAVADYNVVSHCTLGPGIRAKAYTAKEGTVGNVVEYTTFYGEGLEDVNSSRSFMELQGNNADIHNNIFYRQNNPFITSAIKVYEQVTGWGFDNDIHDNTFYLDDPSVYLIETVSGRGTARVSNNTVDPPECLKRYRPNNTTGVTEY